MELIDGYEVGDGWIDQSIRSGSMRSKWVMDGVSIQAGREEVLRQRDASEEDVRESPHRV